MCARQNAERRGGGDGCVLFLPQMRPQSCKSKGRRFQQRIVKTILDAFPHLAPDDVVSTSMGANGEDVRLSPLARGSLPLSLECKCVEKLNVWTCVEQASSNAPEGSTPCLVFSRNRSPAYAVVPWEVLLGLYADRASPREELPPRLGDLLRQIAEFAPKGQGVAEREARDEDEEEEDEEDDEEGGGKPCG